METYSFLELEKKRVFSFLEESPGFSLQAIIDAWWSPTNLQRVPIVELQKREGPLLNVQLHGSDATGMIEREARFSTGQGCAE
ncbi:hypothetical protein GOP47_0009194 [Adiantum capillus-veneris]|uniref:Uncharacterized protein n=1 Tax=Adiantum capillus-veneris TaxID=13818 RepID=A0A9D4UW54_ADICA|nr:hypothetical protein GOP47_0009194 [Adiantum capillus-veneris]